MDDIERARLEAKREALTGYSDYLAVSGNRVAANMVRAYRDQQYPAPKPPLPTEPGSLLRLDNDNDHFAVLRNQYWHATGDGNPFTLDALAIDFPDAVQVFAKTQDEWDTLIAEAEKRGRDKGLDEAEAAFEPKFNTSTQPLYTSGVTVIDTGEAKRRIRALRDGEAS